jgi:hypothetical protein
MEITDKDYSVIYDEATNTVYCSGIMRLNGGQAYEPILQLLNQIADLDSDKIIMNLQGLKALNSSGISMLGRFIFSVDSKKNIELLLQGAKEIPWQQKWAKNFQRLMPTLQFEWV